MVHGSDLVSVPRLLKKHVLNCIGPGFKFRFNFQFSVNYAYHVLHWCRVRVKFQFCTWVTYKYPILQWSRVRIHVQFVHIGYLFLVCNGSGCESGGVCSAMLQGSNPVSVSEVLMNILNLHWSRVGALFMYRGLQIIKNSIYCNGLEFEFNWDCQQIGGSPNGADKFGLSEIQICHSHSRCSGSGFRSSSGHEGVISILEWIRSLVLSLVQGSHLHRVDESDV